VQDVVGKLFAMGALRDALLIAVGGGATSDLVGFVASIYMRGVAWLAVPTTLLGMADASIGGKTGIDTLFGKNLLGTLYPPRAVFADLSLLKSLSERTWNQGLFEILKLGLVFDLSIWEMAVRSSKDPSLIASAIAGKIAIVERDPHESGLRRILNFGHTIGHGLEWLSRYTLPHGEAVALGSIAEAHLSRALGYLSQEEFQRVEAGYRPFSLHWPQQVSLSALWEALLFDKKGSQGQVRFTVIDRIGHALEFQGDYCRPLLPEELKETLIWMERHWS
jgi:3-dehydroquinate synthase